MFVLLGWSLATDALLYLTESLCKDILYFISAVRKNKGLAERRFEKSTV